MSEIENNVAENATAETQITKEIVTINGESFETVNVATGINSISFTLANFDISTAMAKFSTQTKLSVSGADMVVYGTYQNLEYVSAEELADGNVIITFRILTEEQIAIRELQKTQLEQDEVIAEIVGGETIE